MNDNLLIVLLVTCLVLLLVLIILIVMLLTKKNNNNNNENYELRKVIDDNLLKLNKEFSHSLERNLEFTKSSLLKVAEGIKKIDVTQEHIDNVSNEIVSLQKILGNKNTRGIYGEHTLANILFSVFNENKNFYELQATLSNGTKVDALLKVALPLGNIPIDSKFPLESYQKMINSEDANYKIQYEKQFAYDLKKHIDDIASKYIITNETWNGAIMFIPAEAIFAYINDKLPSTIEYAYKKRVWITSPTTLMATLNSILMVIKNIEMSKNTKLLQKQLNLLAEEFDRYLIRWNGLVKHVDSVLNDVKDVSITSNKIKNKFEQIANIDMEEEN
ncbi:MAG: DNA recombination protein RmuC [Bacilli bacterium]|nr:DNA recombination protein RmuC [Bacilli bacterium]